MTGSQAATINIAAPTSNLSRDTMPRSPIPAESGILGEKPGKPDTPWPPEPRDPYFA